MSNGAIYISNFEIPVEIFCFFLVNNIGFFTVHDVSIYLKQRFRVELRDDRIREILKAFEVSGKLKRELRSTERTRNNKVPHYAFNRIV